MNDDYVKKFKIETVGSSMHKELWIPAEELEEFNRNIIGKIKIADAFYGQDYNGKKIDFHK